MTRPATSRPRMKGLWYCSTCGKHSGSREAIVQHVRDSHGGIGQILQEPSRGQLLLAFIAAKRLAEAARAHLHLSDCDTREQLAAQEQLDKALGDFNATVPEAGQ